MFIVKPWPTNQAPSGAARAKCAALRSYMPLLTELEKSSGGPSSYKHAAPDGVADRRNNSIAETRWMQREASLGNFCGCFYAGSTDNLGSAL